MKITIKLSRADADELIVGILNATSYFSSDSDSVDLVFEGKLTGLEEETKE